MRDIFIMICLLLTSCTYQVDNCHITPKVNAEDVDITKIVSKAYPNVTIEAIKKIDDNFHEIIIR